MKEEIAIGVLFAIKDIISNAKINNLFEKNSPLRPNIDSSIKIGDYKVSIKIK